MSGMTKKPRIKGFAAKHFCVQTGRQSPACIPATARELARMFGRSV